MISVKVGGGEPGKGNEGETMVKWRDLEVKLFIPPYDKDAALWSVPPPPIEEIASSSSRNASRQTGSRGFASDILDFETSELGYVGKSGSEQHFRSLTESKGSEKIMIHLLSTDPTTNLYPSPPGYITSLLSSSSSFEISSTHLLPALHNARLIKSPSEIEYIREACRISSEAHEVLMRELGRFARIRAGESGESEKGDEGKMGMKNGGSGVEGLREWEIKSEQDAEAIFVASCKRQG